MVSIRYVLRCSSQQRLLFKKAHPLAAVARHKSTSVATEFVPASHPSAHPLHSISPPSQQHTYSENVSKGSNRYPIRTDWTKEEISHLYNQPLLDLIHEASTAHRQYFNSNQVQRCTLLSIKTGGCPETCKYCSQSSRYKTEVKAEKLMNFDDVMENARRAKEQGSTRFCMGAAWRGPSQVGERQFGRVLDMVKGVRGLGLEVCATLGMVTEEQAKKLQEAGLTAYNHNLDTSEEYYPKVITSRQYRDRLETLSNVRKAGISVCCGGIIGLGESHADRISLIHTLATLPSHPESVPVNALVANKGTPMEDMEPVPVWDLCRMIATARLVMPKSMVRLSAGRLGLSQVEQALCFLAGANSIFVGDKLLTTPNPAEGEDAWLEGVLGLTGREAFASVKTQDDANANPEPSFQESTNGHVTA